MSRSAVISMDDQRSETQLSALAWTNANNFLMKIADAVINLFAQVCELFFEPLERWADRITSAV